MSALDEYLAVIARERESRPSETLLLDEIVRLRDHLGAVVHAEGERVPWWHRHRWAESHRVFVPPSPHLKVDGPTYAAGPLLRDAAFGFTTFVMRCRCGDLTTRTAPGDLT